MNKFRVFDWLILHSPFSDSDAGIHWNGLCLIDLNLPVVQDEVLVGLSLEPFREDPVVRSKNMVAVPHNQIGLSHDSIIRADQDIAVLFEFVVYIIQVSLCQFGSNVVAHLVLLLGVESGVQIFFQVFNGQKGLEEGEPADWKSVVIYQVYGLG